MAPQPSSREYVAECFWPGVRVEDLRALDEQATRSAARVSGRSGSVRYLGSILMGEDEVVLCLFSGQRSAVQRAAQEADIQFERILESVRSPHLLDRTPESDRGAR